MPCSRTLKMCAAIRAKISNRSFMGEGYVMVAEVMRWHFMENIEICAACEAADAGHCAEHSGRGRWVRVGKWKGHALDRKTRLSVLRNEGVNGINK